MTRLLDLTGQKFGRLTVVCRAENDRYNAARWTCECECGATCIVAGKDLRCGHTLSCGCLRKEAAHNKSTHGLSRTRIYRIWSDMKNRCYNRNVPNYKNYGERGIRVCDEWLDPSKFFEWAFNSGYTDELTIERIDLDGNYEPENCKWITLKQQQANKTTSHIVTINGKSKCLREWCDDYEIDYKTVHHRINCLGWDAEKALTTKIRRHKPYKRRQVKHG